MPISHKYLLKLQREVAAYNDWLANTRPEADGSASPAELQAVFTKANAIYLKALALYRATAEQGEQPVDEEPGEFTLSGS